ncbi:MAG: glycosyltransferase [Bryobacteraceae bacterium]
MQPEGEGKIAILIPVFNDWEAVSQLLSAIDRAMPATGFDAEVVLIDDGSTEPAPLDAKFLHLQGVEILRLRRNLGHQRAIAIGLVHAHQQVACEAVVVMDGDGEDRPEDIGRLLECYRRERKVVFAARKKRLESAVFQLFYHGYRLAHYVLTGIAVRVGNFSVVPRPALERLMVVSELWNHYAAAVIRSRIPFATIPIDRGRRLAGRSKMNFVSLLVHGLSAISVFGDVVAARMLAVSAGAVGLALALIGVVVMVRLATDMAIPGWATFTTGLLLVALAQALTISFFLVFTIVGARANLHFLPLRDGPHFVRGVERIFRRA